MADFEVNITPRSGLATINALARSFDQLARKQRILEHLAQSRRARLASNFDDRSTVAQARIQRRLAARRQDAIANQAQVPLAEPKSKPAAAGSQQTLPEAESAGDSATVQEWHDLLARFGRLGSGVAPFAGQAPEASTAAARRSVRIQNQAPTIRGPEQNEIARLQARANAETQRADLVVALLENVLSASTARIIQHQARLEAMQAQLNALQGR